MSSVSRESLLGRSFGLWIVEGEKKVSKPQRKRPRQSQTHRRVYLECRCACGRRQLVTRANLANGRSRGCRVCVNVSRRKPVEEVLHTRYRNGARARGLAFDLTLEDVRKLIAAPCFFCGAEPTLDVKSQSSKLDMPARPFNGIDRLDNDWGYITPNVVTCCWPCNRAKGTTSTVDFVALAKRIASRHG